ncbi:MAG TPA: YidC/Oxa1 family membrane protein insertase [Candidatus Saccharimonadales bacterium]|nr:YidC/Oxa1 family membrane protein insertase [Candidatus Saccharimonadales bacterium]
MFGIFSQLYITFLYQPIYNVVIILYNHSPGPNLGWAMVMLALIVRLLMLPLTLRGYRTDHLLEESARDLREMENDTNLAPQEKRNKITAYLRAKGINPTSEIISVIAQLLFLAVLYQVVQHGITPEGYNMLYSFVKHPIGDLNTVFFFNVNVATRSVLYSAIAAALLFVEQLWEYESKKNIPEATFSERWYPLLLPIFTFILLVFLPATKAVFLGTSILFSLGVRTMFTLGSIGKSKK